MYDAMWQSDQGDFCMVTGLNSIEQLAAAVLHVWENYPEVRNSEGEVLAGFCGEMIGVICVMHKDSQRAKDIHQAEQSAWN